MFGYFLYGILAAFCAFVAYVFRLAWRSNTFWQRQQGIPYIPGIPFVGNLGPILGQQSSIVDHYDSVYNHERARDAAVVGVNLFMRPALVIRDPELIKNVLVRDFPSFCNRYAASDMHKDLMGSCSMLLMKCPAWRTSRQRLSPFFTSGKMRQMYSLMSACGRDLNAALLGPMAKRPGERSESVVMEVKELFGCYATDIIASCAFGVQADSLRNPDSDFRRHGRAIFDFTFWRGMEVFGIFLLPAAVPIFGLKFFSGKSTTFLRESIEYVMDEREKSKNERNDLIDTLVALREEDKDKKLTVDNPVFQGDVLVAQAASFFTASYETTSTSLAFGIYELCRRPDVQSRLRTEIRAALRKCAPNTEPTHDDIFDMPYMGMVISEILRMYPPLPFLDRECTIPAGSTYDLSPHSPFKIPASMPIVIPIFSLQRDAQYFPRPNEFDPERFSDANVSQIVPYTYLPFGAGPHNCVGTRFGLLQMRVALFQFFRSCRVEPAPNGRTPERIQYDKRAFLITPESGITVKVVRDEVSVE